MISCIGYEYAIEHGLVIACQPASQVVRGRIEGWIWHLTRGLSPLLFFRDTDVLVLFYICSVFGIE